MENGDMEELERGEAWNTKNDVTTLLICKILKKKNLIELKNINKFL